MANDAPDLLKRTAITSSNNHWSGGAKGWLERFPQLEAAINGTTYAERCVQIWTALGENHWMEFIDGRAHAGGKHVFDHTENPGRFPFPSGPKTFELQDRMYAEFSKEEAWGSRWTVDKLAKQNSFFREAMVVPCQPDDCFDHLFQKTVLSATKKREMLGRILAEYYEAIDAIQAPMSDSDHIRQALPLIAKLNHDLANLHTFQDANSRVRTLVLQTELVRQGGHPLVLGQLGGR